MLLQRKKWLCGYILRCAFLCLSLVCANQQCLIFEASLYFLTFPNRNFLQTSKLIVSIPFTVIISWRKKKKSPLLFLAAYGRKKVTVIISWRWSLFQRILNKQPWKKNADERIPSSNLSQIRSGVQRAKKLLSCTMRECCFRSTRAGGRAVTCGWNGRLASSKASLLAHFEPFMNLH